MASFKTISLKYDFFYHFLCVFFDMYIAPGRGMTTERPFLFAYMLQVAKWSLQNLILYTFLMILYTYIAPEQGHKTPWGQFFKATESPYHFDHLLQVSNKSLWILILYTFLNGFPHVYRVRGRQPFVDKILISTERPCHLAHLLQVHNIYLKSDFIHIFACFIHVHSPKSTADNPQGSVCLF